MLNAIFGRSKAPAMTPEEVRALRDELGWTQEQVADTACVIPLEVSAWEAGVVPVPDAQAAVLARAAWQERRERAWAQAGTRPCAWAAKILATYEDLQHDEYDGLDRLSRASRRLRAHQKRCAVCQRAAEVERRLPPSLELFKRASSVPLESRYLAFSPEDKPLTPTSVLGLAVMVGLCMTAVMLSLALLYFIDDPSAGFRLSLDMPLLSLSLVAGWLAADKLWGELHFARPYLGGFLKAATVCAPVAAVAMWRLDGFPSDGVIAALAVAAAVLYGRYLGQKEVEAQASEKHGLLTRDGASTPPSLPGPRVEPELDHPSASREMMEAGRSEH